MGKLRQVFWEFGTKAKASATTVHAADLTVGNIVAQDGLKDDFIAAITAVSLGNPGSVEWMAEATEVAKTPSTDEQAQRENKWLVSFVDNTTGLGGSFTIPCPDLAQLGPDGEEMATGANRTALIDATEAYVLSNTGHAVTVTGIKFSARNI